MTLVGSFWAVCPVPKFISFSLSLALCYVGPYREFSVCDRVLSSTRPLYLGDKHRAPH